MLDIKYFKQIDEVLEVEGFSGIYKCQTNLSDKPMYFMVLDGEGFTSSHKVVITDQRFITYFYPLYLQRVIEAINREYWNKYYLQADDIGIHFVTYPDLKIEETWILSAHNFCYDLCKEKAIIYIMDHIKENV